MPHETHISGYRPVAPACEHRCMTQRHLEDLAIGPEIDLGIFIFSRAEIIAFAAQFDPQPFHLDEEAARRSYFGGLVASGVHTQAAAIGLLVRGIADVAVVAGGALHEAKFFIPVRPDTPHRVAARWTETRPSARNPARGVAIITGEARTPDGDVAMTFGVTYVVARRPNHD